MTRLFQWTESNLDIRFPFALVISWNSKYTFSYTPLGTHQVQMFIFPLLVLNFSHLLRQKTTNFAIACTAFFWNHNRLSSICVHIRGAGMREWMVVGLLWKSSLTIFSSSQIKTQLRAAVQMQTCCLGNCIVLLCTACFSHNLVANIA